MAAAATGLQTPRRKRFGQHFLHDPTILQRIVAAIAPGPDDRLVEIGPGRGALTRLLLTSSAAATAAASAASAAACAARTTIDAIEIDRDLAALLHFEFATEPRLRLHTGDALEFDFTALARERGGRLRVVGNLPYNISTPLLFHLLEHRSAIQDLHIMLQKEVVARMAAGAGENDYGRLTVMLAPWCRVERLFDVGPGAFRPPPRVWSAVVRLSILPEPAFPVSEHFGRVVSAAFTQRRKTLRNSLRELLSAAEIESAGLDPSARPETLPPEAFNALARKIVRWPPGA
ncbi:MAG TPA: 16S rRNA (adenine(1518)-N(6)/adenine(1519)-N(6))-dimethyltransferase RsmA [Steroidobacteraceae bacterium]|nr:16S rRNA (adenine(1518)-N(6)/adenine(1519)-N(6))-dimethyltransferase RsmA [Steroidobacteraceae bacterium]